MSTAVLEGRRISTGGPIFDFVYETSRIDEFENFCQSVTQHSLELQATAAQRRSKVEIHGSQSLGFGQLQYGVPLKSTTKPQANDRVAVIRSRQGAAGLRTHGMEAALTHNQAAVVSLAEETETTIPFDTMLDLVFLDRRVLEEQCAKLLGRELRGSLSYDPQFSFATAGGESWEQLVLYAMGEFGNPHSLARQLGTIQRQIEQMVMTSFLLSHRHSYSDALLQPQSAAVPFYVKRAEEYIEAHFADPLSLADIAAHAGVSARSLQNGFQSFRNMTPMAFLRQVRLQHVHHRLCHAHPSTTTVTEVVLSCGFGHLGEFAALYKRHYGVTPKETLSRSFR